MSDPFIKHDIQTGDDEPSKEIYDGDYSDMERDCDESGGA